MVASAVVLLASAVPGECLTHSVPTAEPRLQSVAKPDASRVGGRLQALLDDLVANEPGVRSAILLVEDRTSGGREPRASRLRTRGPGTSRRPIHHRQHRQDDDATIAMRLVEAGVLKLDDRIAAYLPDS